ncbi:MAG TPA: hypothetical protein VN934_03545 [Candidatus Tumulicola sp.]|nr:hypothetical protein [Candidatus Tumulicola sp.]
MSPNSESPYGDFFAQALRWARKGDVVLTRENLERFQHAGHRLSTKRRERIDAALRRNGRALDEGVA